MYAAHRENAIFQFKPTRTSPWIPFPMELSQGYPALGFRRMLTQADHGQGSQFWDVWMDTKYVLQAAIAYSAHHIDLETNLSVLLKEHEMFWSSGPASYCFWPYSSIGHATARMIAYRLPRILLDNAVLDP
jgi:hypothetical protein